MIPTTPLGCRISVDVDTTGTGPPRFVGREQLRRPLEVVADHHRRVAGLLDRHPPVLAALGLDQVGGRVRVVDEEGVRLLEHLEPLRQRPGRPLGLGLARRGVRRLDVGGRRLRQLDEHLAGVDLGELPGAAGGRRHARDQRLQELVGEGLGSLQGHDSTSSDALSPIMIDGAFVLPPVIDGMIEASATRRPSMPRTLRSGPTTARSSTPIRQVPTPW